MKIALIAPSGAGKTVYLTGLHGVFTDQLNGSDYGITYEITDRVKSTFLDERYTKLIEEDDFGQPSKDITRYPVRLTTKKGDGKKCLDLEIVDFPGEALYRATEESKAKVEKIVSDLSDCDGFIVLLDGEYMIKASEKEEPRILQNRLKADAVQKVLEQALERRSKRLQTEKVDPDAYAFSTGLTPVVFALTKGDLVEDWLSQARKEKAEKLNGVVSGVFNLIGKDAKPGERAIASLIRSQYGKILDAPGVASLRTCVTVYDQKKKKFNPRGLEHLFQYVLFVGLQNAEAEYQSRIPAWQKDLEEKDEKLASEKGAYERASSARAAHESENIVGQFLNFISGEGQSFHDDRCARWYADMERAAKANEASRLALKKVKDNKETAGTFKKTILSDELVFLLSQSTAPESFYQAGLPMDHLQKYDWWKEKFARGEKVYKKAHPERPEPGGP